MNGNSFGTLFKISCWGDSHGPAMGCVIDGCPSGIALSDTDFTAAMAARQGGNSDFSTPRKESDQVLIESGVFDGMTTGAPIALRILNQNSRSQDYDQFKDTPRPGHGDYTSRLKHPHYDWRGGGRLSARETVSRVAASVVAQKILDRFNIETLGFVSGIGKESFHENFEFYKHDEQTIVNKLWPQVLSMRNNELQFPAEKEIFSRVLGKLREIKEQGDSLGGSVDCWVRGLPVGLGEPVFDKTQAIFAHALMSLPAATGFESGGGVALSKLPGSEVRDAIHANGPIGNRHGGLLGGLTSGKPMRLRVHFHAPTSIPQKIESFDFAKSESQEIIVGGRHDCFPLPRAVPMVEAMVKLCLVDLLARAGKLPASY